MKYQPLIFPMPAPRYSACKHPWVALSYFGLQPHLPFTLGLALIMTLQ